MKVTATLDRACENEWPGYIADGTAVKSRIASQVGRVHRRNLWNE